MDDLSNIISQAMNDPDTMSKVSSLLNSLSGGTENSATPAPAAPAPVQNADNTALAAPDMAKLMQIGTMLTQGGANDPNIALLMALKPLLKEENQAKADRMVKLFRLMSAYPMLRDSGLF